MAAISRPDSPAPDVPSHAPERHEEFERVGQRERGPGTDQGTDKTVADAVRQVGIDGGDNPGTKAPACQWRYRLAPPTGLEDEHARARIRPSAMNGTSRAVRPVSPSVLVSSSPAKFASSMIASSTAGADCSVRRSTTIPA